MLKQKKGQISKLTAIAFSILVFFILIKLSFYIFGGVGKSAQEEAGYIDDYDKDGAINGPKGSYTKASGFDACPCIPGDIKNDGCSLNYKIRGDNKGLEDRTCLSKLT